MTSRAAGGWTGVEIFRARPPWVISVAVATAAIVIAYAAWVAFHVGGERLAVAVDDVGVLVVVIAATVLTGVRAMVEVDPRMRRGWLLLSLACAAWTVGQVIQTRGDIGLTLAARLHALTDVGYLSATGLQVAGVLVLAGSRARGSWLRSLLNGSIVAGALLLVGWPTVAQAVQDAQGKGSLSLLVGVAYPIGYMVTMLVVLSAVSYARQLTAALIAAFAGISSLVIADATYAYLAQVSVHHGPNVVDAGRVVGFLLVGVGALVRGGRGSEGEARPNRWQVLAHYMPLVVACVLVAVDELRPGALDAFSQDLVAFLIGLVLARQLIEMVEVQGLASRLQRALKASADASAERETLIEHAPVGICRINGEGRLMSVNQTLQTMLGYSAEEMIGRSFLHFQHEEDRAQDLPTYLAIVEGRTNRFAKENRFKRKDGTVIWCMQVGIAIRGPDGRLESVVGMLDDLTDRKLQNERAARIQRQLLPQATPWIEGYELVGACRPAEDVGGDLYDWITLADGTLDLTVADVMGKGVSAALVMASLRTALRTTSPELGPAARIRQVADSIGLESVDEELFVTLFHARLDLRSGVLRYVDAGHSYCLIRQSDGELARLTERSLPVGVLPEADFHEGAHQLCPGDTLVVYSDGLIEAPAAGAEELEVEPEVSSATSADDVVRRLMSRMPTRPVDDVTVVALRRL